MTPARESESGWRLLYMSQRVTMIASSRTATIISKLGHRRLSTLLMLMVSILIASASLLPLLPFADATSHVPRTAGDITSPIPRSSGRQEVDVDVNSPAVNASFSANGSDPDGATVNVDVDATDDQANITVESPDVDVTIGATEDQVDVSIDTPEVDVNIGATEDQVDVSIDTPGVDVDINANNTQVNVSVEGPAGALFELDVSAMLTCTIMGGC